MAKAHQPIPVHALDDPRIHLAPPHLGRLAQGRLKTHCGRQAVSALPLFALVEPGKKRCPTCFGLIDEHGALKPGKTVKDAPAEKPKPAARQGSARKAPPGKSKK